MADSRDVKRGIVGAIIFSIFVLAFFVLKPIIVPIIFGLLFAYIFNPLYKAIKPRLKIKGLAAFILVFLFIIVVAVPIVYLVPALVKQIFETYVLFQNFNFGEFFSNFIEGGVSPTLVASLNNIIGKFFSTSLAQFTNVLVNLPSLILQFIVFLFTFYFSIKDGDELREYISTLSPFSDATEKKFLKEFRGITNAIVFGQVFIGIVQGLAVGAGLFFLGVPKVLTLTFVASIVSMIPILGSWIVWFPTSLILLITGQTFSGIFLLLYGALFVSTIDNLLRPYILSRQSNLPVALSIIGTIGGLYFFGIAGLLLGPLVLAYVLIIIEFYQQGKLKDLFNK
ncbi:MAG: AI-2E family transporter [Nanoarchaeota archaeon]|nr:AI-2E family transporter [Nanoarchaeota archaeon]